MVFKLRMAVTALQGEFNESVTVSTTIVPEKSIYGTVPLDAHDEVSQVEPDGFHGKSYKDFKKNQVLPE